MNHTGRLTDFFRKGGQNFEIQEHIYMKMGGCKNNVCFRQQIGFLECADGKTMEREKRDLQQ